MIVDDDGQVHALRAQVREVDGRREIVVTITDDVPARPAPPLLARADRAARDGAHRRPTGRPRRPSRATSAPAGCGWRAPAFAVRARPTLVEIVIAVAAGEPAHRGRGRGRARHRDDLSLRFTRDRPSRTSCCSQQIALAYYRCASRRLRGVAVSRRRRPSPSTRSSASRSSCAAERRSGGMPPGDTVAERLAHAGDDPQPARAAARRSTSAAGRCSRCASCTPTTCSCSARRPTTSCSSPARSNFTLARRRRSAT